MKNIDPLYILILLVTVSIISLNQLSQSNTDLKKKVIEYKELNNLAIKYSSLKSDWSTKDEVIKKINKILKILKIRSKPRVTNNKIYLEVDNLNLKTLDKLLNRILNEKLKIEKLDFNRTTLTLEVGV